VKPGRIDHPFDLFGRQFGGARPAARFAGWLSKRDQRTAGADRTKSATGNGWPLIQNGSGGKPRGGLRSAPRNLLPSAGVNLSLSKPMQAERQNRDGTGNRAGSRKKKPTV
jgi:hypothetical protein